MNARDEQGNIIYLDLEDRKVDDVWRVPLLVRTAQEYTGYPTQKTEALIERIIDASTSAGDIVLDAFAGSGTTCGVAEKLERRWIAIDSGKLAIYTIQKRMLNLTAGIGQKGKPLTPKPFTLYNAGLYDFSTLRKLPWEDWRFFALRLFESQDDPHTIGGLKLDGRRRGHSVYIFNHHKHPGKRIDEETIHQIHTRVGDKVGSRFYIIAPKNVFDFQQDYLEFDEVRYYALRIPYSFISELHTKGFTSIRQPNDETAVNDIVDAYGFDFIQPPVVKWAAGAEAREGQLLAEAFIRIEEFASLARIRGSDRRGGLETLSMLMLDLDYNGEVFDIDHAYYGHQLESDDWRAWFPLEGLGAHIMALFIDIHGNESQILISSTAFDKRQDEEPTLQGQQ